VTPNSRFAVILLLGPGGHEVDRTLDLLDAIHRHEPERVSACDLFVVDDGGADARVLEEATRPFSACVWLRNPLSGSGRHPYDKMAAGVLHALSHAIERAPYAFALKLDTDALVINPFHDGIARLFASDPGIGVAGSYLRFPDGAPRPGNARWAPRVHNATSLRRALRSDPKIGGVVSRTLRAYRRKRIVGEARRHGYAEGHHVLGGSYAVSGSLLSRWRGLELKRLVRAFEDTQLSEDVVVSMLAMWAGYTLVDHNAPGEVFGVWHRALGAPPAALAREYSIVHSLKTADGQDEAELRRIFRTLRGEVPVERGGWA
jgi:hypothetical protein